MESRIRGGVLDRLETTTLVVYGFMNGFAHEKDESFLFLKTSVESAMGAGGQWSGQGVQWKEQVTMKCIPNLLER